MKTSFIRICKTYRSNPNLRAILWSSMIGNALEWYDFVLYGYFAGMIGKMIFPPANDTLAILLKSYFIFFLGFLMRPLGALIFGYIGDHYGRKKALMLSIYCMAIPTTCIGLIPSYAQVGFLAPIILTILRLFQGLSMGGEFTGSMIFIIEHAPSKQKGFWGSMASLSVLMGLTIGSTLCMGISFVLSPQQLASFGWRIPFIISALGSIIGLYMRKYAHETGPCLDQSSPDTKQKPLAFVKDLLKNQWQSIGRVFLIDIAVAVGFFMTCIYIMSYLQNPLGASYQFAAISNTVSMIIFASVIPLAGIFSDRIGIKKMLGLGISFMAMIALPCFAGLISQNTCLIVCAHAFLSLAMGLIFAPLPAFLAASFSPATRYSGVSLAHNLSMTLFGGSAPHMATFLLKYTHWSLIPGALILVACVVSRIALKGWQPYDTNTTFSFKQDYLHHKESQ